MRTAVSLTVKGPDKKNFELTDQVMADLNDGSGSSGSGIILGRTGRLIGVLRIAAVAATDNSDKTGFKLLVPVSQVRAFLKSNGIPHHDASGEVRPMPPPPSNPGKKK